MDPSRAKSGVKVKKIYREITKNYPDQPYSAVHRVRFDAKISQGL